MQVRYREKHAFIYACTMKHREESRRIEKRRKKRRKKIIYSLHVVFIDDGSHYEVLFEIGKQVSFMFEWTTIDRSLDINDVV